MTNFGNSSGNFEPTPWLPPELQLDPGEIDRLSPVEQMEYLELLEEAYNQRLTDDLGFFIAESWPVVEPKTPFSGSWHYEYMCEWLMDVADGTFRQKHPEKEGIIFNVPPRTGKSTMITVDFPVWTWLKYPERRFLCASYSGK